MSKTHNKNQKKSGAAQAPKRGRGRPSKVDAQLALTSAAHLAAIDFIRSLKTDESEQWLAGEGYLTHAQVYADELRQAAEKRAELEKTISDAQSELAKLGAPTVLIPVLKRGEAADA